MYQWFCDLIKGPPLHLKQIAKMVQGWFEDVLDLHKVIFGLVIFQNKIQNISLACECMTSKIV